MGKFQWIAEKFGIAEKEKSEDEIEPVNDVKKPDEDIHEASFCGNQHPPAPASRAVQPKSIAVQPQSGAPHSGKINQSFDNESERPGSSESINSRNKLI